ncbi:MAG: hypothetical protein HY925_09155, partial [Elusimicrobia bacterium]|nr:hypothetical protein [Elusimicrobiota bacterium]
MKTPILAALLAAALAAPAAAQDRLLDLERKIDALTHEVEQLKLGSADAADHAAGAGKVYGAAQRRVSVGGYGELVAQRFSRTTQNGGVAGKRNETDAQRIVMYLGYK